MDLEGGAPKNHLRPELTPMEFRGDFFFSPQGEKKNKFIFGHWPFSVQHLLDSTSSLFFFLWSMVVIFSVMNKVVAISFQKGLTLPEINMAPKNGWLEDDPFLLGPDLFSGAMLVSRRVMFF